MKTKIFVSIIAGFFLLAPSLSAQPLPSEEPKKEPSDPWIEAYAGLGYYSWSLKSLNTKSKLRSVDTDIQPFILKKFEVKSNLRIVQFGLNYFTNRFDNAFNTTEEADVEKKNDPLARQLAMFASLDLGPIALTSDAAFRKFQGNVKSKGLIANNGVSYPALYYTDSGVAIPLPAGTEVSWYTILKDYTIKAGMPRKRKPGANFALELGVRIMKYSSPTEFVLDYPVPGTYTHRVIPTLMVANITQYFGGFSFWFNYTAHNGLFWDFFVPAYLGLCKTETAYFTLDKSFSSTSTGHTNFGFTSGNFRIVTGIEYNLLITMTVSDFQRVKKDVPYYRPADGTLDQFNSGTRVEISSGRFEFFWGAYIHASLMW